MQVRQMQALRSLQQLVRCDPPAAQLVCRTLPPAQVLRLRQEPVRCTMMWTDEESKFAQEKAKLAKFQSARN